MINQPIRDSSYDLEKQRISERMVLLENKLEDVKERLDRHGKNYEDMAKDINLSLKSINEAVIGTPEKPGMGEEIRNLKKWVGTVKALCVAVGFFALDLIRGWFTK